MEELQRQVQDVEFVGEELLVAKRQLVEADKLRNETREALTALRRQARTSKSSIFQQEASSFSAEGGKNTGCPTCGDFDGSTRVWKMCPGADVFVRLPFHQVHCDLEKAQIDVESEVKSLQSTVKDKAFSLSNKGAIGDLVRPDIMDSFVTLKG